MNESSFQTHHIGSVTLQQLRCFAAVAERKSFRKTATDLGIEQPAVSRAVKRLEEILGAGLFSPGDRTRLTGFGERVYREAGRVLGTVESLKRLAGDEAGLGRTAGRVIIGTKSILAETLLPKLAGRFRQKHRRASICIRCGSGEDLLNMLRSGDIDIAVSHARPCPDAITFRRIWVLPRLLVALRSHPLARKRLTVQRLAGADLILPARNTRTYAELTERLGRAVPKEEIRTAIEMPSAAAQIRYAAEGWGVTVIDGSAKDLVTGALVARPLPESILPAREAGVFFSAERYVPSAVRTFVKEAFGFIV